MQDRTRTAPRSAGSKAIRQTVTIPAPLAREVRRVAEERHMTISRALVALAERGVRAELDAKENLQAAYRGFMEEEEPALREEAGQDLIRAIFGKGAIAENPIL